MGVIDYYIGIDPGKNGAIAVICSINDDITARARSFEKIRYKTILKYLPEEDNIVKKNVFCVLERVSAMPGQGVKSMFSFGENYGYIQGLLEAYEVPYELVTPQTWKKEFGVTSDKNTSIDVCERLFPSVDLYRTERSRKKDDGLAEAILLAEYARRKFNGK